MKNVKIPTGGKLVIPTESSDPTAELGRIYVSTTQFKVYVNGAWRVVTVS
jgi:hypothetical protein